MIERYFKNGEPVWGTIIGHAVLAVLILIVVTAFWPLSSVPTGSRGVVTQFGRIIGIEPEGLVALWPWQKLALFSIRAESAQIDNAEGATNDTQPVRVSLTVRYSVFPEKVSDVYEKYSHTGDLSNYVETATHEVFKAVTARYAAPDLVGQRARVSADINQALQAKLAVYDAHVISIDMRSFSFQESYMQAINEKVRQEQLRLVAENKLLTTQAEQKSRVAIAEADAATVKARADGDAYATLKNAQAQAEALKIQNQALAQNHDVLELRRIEVDRVRAEKWDGKLPENVYAGAPLPFLNTGK